MKGKCNLRRPARFLARSASRKHGVTWPPLAQTHALQTHVHTPTPAGGTRAHSWTKCQHKPHHTHTHTHADYMTAPWLPSRVRLMPAEVSRPAQVTTGEAAIVQNNYPIITFTSPSDKSFAAICRLHRRPALFVRLEVITAVIREPCTASSSTYCSSLFFSDD